MGGGAFARHEYAIFVHQDWYGGYFEQGMAVAFEAARLDIYDNGQEATKTVGYAARGSRLIHG